MENSRSSIGNFSSKIAQVKLLNLFVCYSIDKVGNHIITEKSFMFL